MRGMITLSSDLPLILLEEKKARNGRIQCFVSFKGLSLYAAETAVPKSVNKSYQDSNLIPMIASCQQCFC